MDFETLISKLRDALMLAIGIVYAVCGFYVIKLEWFLTKLDSEIAWILGIIVIAFGFFRVYRAIQILKKGVS